MPLYSTLKKIGIGTACTLLALLLIGSVADFGLSSLLYHGSESGFDKMIESFSEFPAFWAVCCAGTLLLLRRPRRDRKRELLWGGAGGALILFGLAFNIRETVSNTPQLPGWIPALITVLCTAVVCVLAAHFTQKKPREQLLRLIFLLVFVSVGTMALTQLLKLFWARPRMRFIYAEGGIDFLPWWKGGHTLKKTLIDAGKAVKDDFRSFPSGHVACASCAMLLPFLTPFSPALRGKEKPLFAAGAVYTAIVCFSRLTMGAHFLTDVAMSCLLTVLLTAAAYYLFYYNEKTFRFFERLVS